MRLIYKKGIAALMFVAAITFSPATYSQSPNYNTSASSTGVLRFQQKMAAKGHPEAQYKLAMMYESGTVVEIDIEQAKIWYNKAAYQNFKAAKNRLIYLDIKQNGFKQAHNFWLNGLRHDALYGDGEALFLLGQMYSYGTGVDRDLKKAVNILKKAVASNILASEVELIRADRAYNEEKQKHAAATRQMQQEQARLAAIQEQNKRKTQQTLLVEKRHKIEQKIIEQQRHQFAKAYQYLQQEQKQAAAIKPAAINTKNEKERVIESVENNICSGKNRFIATCR
jgi:TPR repeat protein